MAIHVRWGPPEGSAIPTLEQLGPSLPDLAAAKAEVEKHSPGAYYGDRLAGLSSLGIETIIHVWQDRAAYERGAREVAWIIQTSK